MTDDRTPVLDPQAREYLERYIVEGPTTLDDPHVASAVATHTSLAHQLLDVAHRWRMLPHKSVESSLRDARLRLGLDTSIVVDHAPLQRSAVPGSGRYLSGTRHASWKAKLVGAAAAFAVLAAGVFYNNLPKKHAPVLRVHTTAKGERSNIMLADGTRIILGVNSRLEYTPYVTTGPRDFHLDGEAYFNVVANAQRPLIVHAKNTATRVLGTEFVVRGYPADSSVRVAVASGKVALDGTVLSAGDIGLRLASHTLVTHSPEISTQFAWTHGQIVFEDAPLSVVLHELSRWYDVKFKVADTLLNQRIINTTFTDRTPDEVAAAIAAALQVRYERRGNVVAFRMGNLK